MVEKRKIIVMMLQNFDIFDIFSAMQDNSSLVELNFIDCVSLRLHPLKMAVTVTVENNDRALKPSAYSVFSATLIL